MVRLNKKSVSDQASLRPESATTACYTAPMPQRPRTSLIDETLVTEQFVRAPGPGGQNVNKVATAVQLRYDVARAPLPADVKRRLAALAGSMMTRDAELVIQASRYRSQARNREDARARLLELLRKASVRPRARIPTAPSAAARERRLQAKQRRGLLKRSRRVVE
jgi:ribosome-associated protein